MGSRFSVRGVVGALALALPTSVAVVEAATPFTSSFELAAPAEVIAVITARCDACAWDVAGREAVTLSISVDSTYVAHLPLVQQGVAEYPVLIGTVGAGRHHIQVGIDPHLTAPELRRDGAARVERIRFTSIAKGHAEHTAVSLAPFVHARANTIGRFTDVPVFMWYEREPTPRGARYRYSVVFTNEDGGTPADRLMATWGRTTDIEYIYSVEVDGAGTIVSDDFQGPEHKIIAFGGTRRGSHPLLWVKTDNNMVVDTGATGVRYAPAPVAFPLGGVSREAVMDAHPWMYVVAGQELAREGKIVENAPPGRGAIPDPRRFVYIEACGDVGRAAIAFEVAAGASWERSDRGVPEYRIARDGCFRAAVPVPAPLGANDLRTLRVSAYARPAKADAPPAAAPPPIRLDRINKVFMLDERHQPGPPILQWEGPTTIPVGSSFDIPIPGRR